MLAHFFNARRTVTRTSDTTATLKVWQGGTGLCVNIVVLPDVVIHHVWRYRRTNNKYEMISRISTELSDDKLVTFNFEVR